MRRQIGTRPKRSAEALAPDGALWKILRTILLCGAHMAPVFVCLTLFAAARAAGTNPSASAQLCTVIICEKPPAPVITQVSPASVLTPGGAVFLYGTNFTDAKGNIGKAVLILRPPGSLGVSRLPGVVLGIQFTLENVQWGNTSGLISLISRSTNYVYGTIPISVSGVTDQPATFEILRNDGLASPPISPPGVQFTAARTGAILPMSDVQEVQCSQAGWENQCNGWADHTPVLEGPMFGSAFSEHICPYTSQAGCLNLSGDDQFSINLRNGWIVNMEEDGGTGWSTAIATLHCTENGSGFGNHFVGMSQGTVDIGYHMISGGSGWAYGECIEFLGIWGPQGVPWK